MTTPYERTRTQKKAEIDTMMVRVGLTQFKSTTSIRNQEVKKKREEDKKKRKEAKKKRDEAKKEDQPRRIYSRKPGVVMQEEQEAPLEDVPEFLPRKTHKLLNLSRFAKETKTRLYYSDAEGGFHDIEGLLRALSIEEQLERKIRKGNRDAERKAISKQFGIVNTVVPGQVFQDKKELHKASVHLSTGGGIWGEKGVGAYAICDSGG